MNGAKTDTITIVEIYVKARDQLVLLQDECNIAQFIAQNAVKRAYCDYWSRYHKKKLKADDRPIQELTDEELKWRNFNPGATTEERRAARPPPKLTQAELDYRAVTAKYLEAEHEFQKLRIAFIQTIGSRSARVTCATIGSLSKIAEMVRKRPRGKHIDHIIPIGDQNANPALTAEGYPVCGLHAWWNLQYLPAKVNSRKGDRMRLQDEGIWRGAPGYIRPSLRG